MYKQYWNDYEKKAEQIRKAAKTIESNSSYISGNASTQSSVFNKERGEGINLGKLQTDDLLLIGLLFLLIGNEKRDTVLILIIGYIFIAGL